MFFYKKYNYTQLSAIVKKGILIINIFLVAFFFGWIVVYYAIINTNHFSMVQLIAQKLIKIPVAPFVIRGLSNTGTKYYLSSNALTNYMESFFTDVPIILDKPKLLFLNKRNENIKVDAHIGSFDAKTKILTLSNNVHIFGDNKLDYFLTSATVDLNSNIIYSNAHTQGVYLNINIVSSGFVFYNHENIIVKGPFTMISTD